MSQLSQNDLSAISNSAYQCDILLNRIYDIPVRIKDDQPFLSAVRWLEVLREELQKQAMELTNKLATKSLVHEGNTPSNAI